MGIVAPEKFSGLSRNKHGTALFEARLALLSVKWNENLWVVVMCNPV